MNPQPTVYIPTLEGGERLARCLDSLSQQTAACDVVVADNGSGSSCGPMLEADFPWVNRIAFGRNLGFGPALNRAIAAYPGDPIILLNDDAVAAPDFVEKLVSASEDGTEMVAAVLESGESPGIIDSAGIEVDHTAMGYDYLSGRPLAAASTAASPFGPTGGAALYRRHAFEAVGGFDERIFLYYEDVDLALRIRSSGGRVRLAPAARATHGYSETLGAGSPAKYRRTGWSRGYMMRTYGITSTPGLGIRALSIELAVCLGQFVRGRTTSGLRGRIAGWRDAGREERRDLPSQGLIVPNFAQALRRRLDR